MNTELIGILVNAVVAIIVAILGRQQWRKNKKDEEYRKLREELEREKEAKVMEEKEESEKRLKNIENNISDLTKEVGELQKTMTALTQDQLEDIQKQLTNLHTMESKNFIYIHSLSTVVVNIGEVLNGSSTIDTKSKDKLEVCIDHHRKKENDIHENLYKLIM